jgi:hypothetical protein
VIKGFNIAFHKKSLKLLKKGTEISVNIKPPLAIDYEDSLDDILAQVMDAIEQGERDKG